MKQEIFILDTNIWISYLLTKRFHQLINTILENNLEILTCKNMVIELEQVLQRKKFKKYIGKKEIDEAVTIHLKLCKFIHIDVKINELTDKKDNYTNCLSK